MMLQPVQDRLAAVLEFPRRHEELPVFVDGIFTVPDVTAALTVPGSSSTQRRPGLLAPGRHPARTQRRRLAGPGLVGAAGRLPPGRGRDPGHPRQTGTCPSSSNPP